MRLLQAWTISKDKEKQPDRIWIAGKKDTRLLEKSGWVSFLKAKANICLQLKKDVI